MENRGRKGGGSSDAFERWMGLGGRPELGGREAGEWRRSGGQGGRDRFPRATAVLKSFASCDRRGQGGTARLLNQNKSSSTALCVKIQSVNIKIKCRLLTKFFLCYSTEFSIRCCSRPLSWAFRPTGRHFPRQFPQSLTCAVLIFSEVLCLLYHTTGYLHLRKFSGAP